MRWILLIRQNVDENTKRKFCYKALSGYGTISQFFNIEREVFKMKRYFFFIFQKKRRHQIKSSLLPIFNEST